MLPDIASAVRLQEVDIRLTELTKEIASLPKHIVEIEKKLESHQRKLEADRAAQTANQKDRKKLEGDIQMQEQKISKLRDQMLQAKTNEQYQAFQHEIGFCQSEIRRAEDRILDLMAESEDLERNVKTAEVALKAEKAQVEAEKQQARERTEADQKAVDDLEASKKSIVASMNPNVYKNYERIRSRRGVAVAEVLDGRCSVCHIAVRPQYLQDLKRGEQVQVCESCQRILYYNPPASFDDIGGPSASAMHT
jgi:predicted  nucleic acid-binding Zn-ribbon protein